MLATYFFTLDHGLHVALEECVRLGVSRTNQPPIYPVKNDG